MHIKVIKGVVEHDGKEYKINEEIKQMKKEHGQRLIDLGMAEKVEKGKNDSDDESGDESEKNKTPSEENE